MLPGVTALLPAQDPDARVELNCKIVRRSERPDHQVWRIEFRKASGEVLNEELRNTGDRIRIRNLKPGIYTLCLYGDRGRQRCESLDLTPPAGRRTTKFSLRFEVPEQTANQSDAFLISARRLSVPRQAHQEMLRSDEAQRRGDSREVVKHLERALQIYPDYPDALNNLGVQMRRSRDYKKAIGLFVRLTKTEPEFYPGWINLGGSLLAVGRYSEALEANLRAQKLRSNDAAANSQLAVNYYYLREYAEATKYFKRVHEIDPLNASSPQLFLAQIASAKSEVPRPRITYAATWNCTPIRLKLPN